MGTWTLCQKSRTSLAYLRTLRHGPICPSTATWRTGFERVFGEHELPIETFVRAARGTDG